MELLKGVWTVLRVAAIPAIMIWMVCDSFLEWYLKIALVLFIANSVIVDCKCAMTRNWLRDNHRRW